LSALNGLTKAAQYLSAGTAGTDFAISSATDTHTFNLPTASASNRGALSSADWSTFNGKQNALTTGNLTDVGTDGITVTGGTGSVIGSGTSIAQQKADATHNGYLSSTDWSTFNGKQNAISLTTTGTSGAATLVGSTLNVPQYAGGLTYFTEAQNSAAPNATVKVDSITALSSTTNADVAIVPKGTGAFTLAVPDSLVSGGNKRGANAVDLQTSRTQAVHVASADFSNLVGGYNNKATGTGSSVFGGYNNNASGGFTSIVGGYGNTNSGNYSIIAGAENNNSGSYGASMLGWAGTNSGNGALVTGYGNANTGAHSLTIGSSNSTGSNYGITGGNSNINTSPTSLVFGASNSILVGGNNIALGVGCTNISGSFGRFIFGWRNTVVGDAQNTRMILSKRTTDATLSALTCDGAATYYGVTEFKLQDNSCVRFKGSIVGKKTGTTNVGVWDFDGVISRVNSVATTAIVVSNVNVVTNASAWGTPTLTVNASYGNLSVNVIGLAATNIQWVCHLECTEVVY
jgi:hypothetical protein